MQARVVKMAQLMGTVASSARGAFVVAERAKISGDRTLYLTFPVTNTNDVEQELLSSVAVTFLSTLGASTNALYSLSRGLYVLVRTARLIHCSVYIQVLFVWYQGGGFRIWKIQDIRSDV